MNFDEAGVIAALARIFGTSQRGVEIGIGDDAAVVKTSERTAITTDIAVEGTHFSTQWSSAFDIGRKITAANLADIYAMGGSPKFLVAAVTLTGEESMEWIEDLAEGIAHEASSCGAYVVGGDLAKGPCKVISIAAIGQIDCAAAHDIARGVGLVGHRLGQRGPAADVRPPEGSRKHRDVAAALEMARTVTATGELPNRPAELAAAVGAAYTWAGLAPEAREALSVAVVRATLQISPAAAALLRFRVFLELALTTLKQDRTTEAVSYF